MSGPPDGADHLCEEAASVPPRVLPPVDARVEELFDQVPVGGRDLDTVEARLGGQLRGARIAGDDLLDLGAGECSRFGTEARARDGRGRKRRWPRRREDLLPAAVEELDEEPRAMGPHGRRHAPVTLDDLRQVAAERVRSQEPGRMNRRRLEHDQADPPARPRLVVGDEVIRRPVVVDERRLVGGRDDPVWQLDRPELERREDVFH